MDEKAREKRGSLRCREASMKPWSSSRGASSSADTLGDHIFDKFLENKKVEWDRLPHPCEPV